MKIVTIVGARPQFIKAAMLSRQLKLSGDVQEVLVHTGQHYDVKMSDIFFDELNIAKPNYNLGIGGGTHGQNTGQMIEAIESVLIAEKPNSVIVYGDTDSTLAGTIAAVKLHIPVIHIEAGLRSFNRRMPEEINRVLTDHSSSLLFAPTQSAVENLLKEGINQNVHLVGDIMYDAALYYGAVAEKQSEVLKHIGISPRSYILATIHRQENTDSQKRLESIVSALNDAPLRVILPLHPRTKSRMKLHDMRFGANVTCIEPLGYIDMVMLEKNAALIATDSGGVQKEAYFHNVPSVIFRQETEWEELIEIQAGVLADQENPVKSINAMLNKDFNNIEDDVYGQGETAKEIKDIIIF